MFEILKMRLQGDTGYRIARKLNMDPPEAYRTLRIANVNFLKMARMLDELRELGWPEKLKEIENVNQASKGRRITRKEEQETPARSNEIPIKLG